MDNKKVCHNCGKVLEHYSNVNLCDACYSQALNEFEKLINYE